MKALEHSLDREFLHVLEFNTKFGLPVGSRPRHLATKDMENRLKFMNEELDELKRSVDLCDLVGQCDALVDLVYVIKGTAVMMGLPWDRLWDAVQEANMQKVNSGNSTDHKIGIVKPAGWVGPERAISETLTAYGAWANTTVEVKDGS